MTTYACRYWFGPLTFSLKYIFHGHMIFTFGPFSISSNTNFWPRLNHSRRTYILLRTYIHTTTCIQFESIPNVGQIIRSERTCNYMYMPARDYPLQMLYWTKNHSFAYSPCDFRLNQAYKCRLVFNKPWVGVISTINFEWQLDRTRLTLSTVKMVPWKDLFQNKVRCVFPMVIWSEFRMWQHRDDDHRDYALHLTFQENRIGCPS